jgi:hypothetical protein
MGYHMKHIHVSPSEPRNVCDPDEANYATQNFCWYDHVIEGVIARSRSFKCQSASVPVENARNLASIFVSPHDSDDLLMIAREAVEAAEVISLRLGYRDASARMFHVTF